MRYSETNDLDNFLDRAVMESGEGQPDTPRPHIHTPSHRQLSIIVSKDKMEAQFEALFANTTPEEIETALQREQIAFGIQKDNISQAHKKAIETGHVQKNVCIAKGKSAEFIKRKEVFYHFLENIEDPETRQPAHLASSFLKNIRNIIRCTNIDAIRGYNHPVLAVSADTPLMTMQGEDEIESGSDVLGHPVTQVSDPGPQPLKAADGTTSKPDGQLVANRFGYLAVHTKFLEVVSPIWISPDSMVAYFVNPPQIGQRIIPTEDDLLDLLEKAGITHGIDKSAIQTLCADLAAGKTREACVRIAKGSEPDLSKNQFLFSFELLPPIHFEKIQNVLYAPHLDQTDLTRIPGQTVNANTVLARQAIEGTKTAPGKNIFGQPVAVPDNEKETKIYRAGINVRREEKEGYIYFISEIFGYVGIVKNKIEVHPPIWVSPDRMTANFIALPTEMPHTRPTKDELHALLRIKHITHGIKDEVLDAICQSWPKDFILSIAQGIPPQLGTQGKIELFFKVDLDPGKRLETGKIDFRERDSVPQTTPNELLAQRSFPKPGKPGCDVRGRKIPAPKPTRGLLYAGPNVQIEEKDGKQYFYATDSGWPRVIKDTLGVMKRFSHDGNIDYRVGNIDIDGDVEIAGSIKSRFSVRATGDIIVGEGIDMNAQIEAGGNIIVQRGIHKAQVKAGGDLFVRFIQDANIEIGGDLLVKNYIQNSDVLVNGKATIQGNEGGQKQLCLLGGTLIAGSLIDVASIGASHGRLTQVMAGFFPDIEKTINRYKKGVDFCNMRLRRSTRTLESILGEIQNPTEQMAMLKKTPHHKRQIALDRLKEYQSLTQMKESLEHHIVELEKQIQKLLHKTEIRVKGSCFRKTNLQIGQIYETLSIDEKEVVFCLSPKGNKLARRPLTKH